MLRLLLLLSTLIHDNVMLDVYCCCSDELTCSAFVFLLGVNTVVDLLHACFELQYGMVKNYQ